MKIENNKLIFELKEEEIKIFELAIHILKRDPDDEIRRFINGLSRMALLESSKTNYDMREKDDAYLINRLERWSERKFGVNYNIMKSFVVVYKDHPEHLVSRKRMEEVFNELEPENVNHHAISRFILNFRMMCSASPKAYGAFFNYNKNNDVVTPNENIKTKILELFDID